MHKYKVSQPITIRSIAMKLTAEQLAARSALVTPQTKDGKKTGLYVPINEVQFKAGEVIELEEELPKALRDKADKTFFGAEPHTGDDSDKETDTATGAGGRPLSVDEERARADHEVNIREAVARGEIDEEEAEKRRNETPEETKERVRKEMEEDKDKDTDKSSTQRSNTPANANVPHTPPAPSNRESGFSSKKK